MSIKIMGVTVVLLMATVSAMVSGIVVFALGATVRSAVGTGGAAFLGIAALGMGVLTYLLPGTPPQG
ncbi:hypothetical protein N8I84_41280 (plasmid) [Streptomyces cynarae]|uniref:DUF2964 family protein n=1 Tax=Streptomyces cynarae TaxID=2981134 RepID=A0ABY6EJK8_9ACTN|nr:hypothetical protein [Streptomyces cynarae]UXY24883.1 hypothetical protein N8I84_41280 [Streptomyces cynarae]